MQTPADFMSRVVPWPGPGEQGYINIHWKLRDRNDPSKTFWAGEAFVSLSQFMGKVNWGVGNPNIVTDIYFCLSRQKDHGGVKNGKLSVKRAAPSATQLRAVWLDVDVKEPPKGYSTYEEAKRAVVVFCTAAGIPFPTAMIASGGGLHAYWISDKVMTVEEWRPYAEGLKAQALAHGLRCDAGLTTDCARILRVPGTYNFKETAPRPVQIDYLKKHDLDFAAALSHITVIAPVTATVTKPVVHDFSHIVVPQVFKDLFDPNDNLANGIDSHKDVELNWKLVEDGCPFFKDAALTHGRDHSQPLWNLVVLASTFFKDGYTIAHELSSGYPSYSVAETDKMYARKEKERVEKNLGWPSCAKIEGDGCTSCAGCPFKGKIKSPLHLGIVHPTAAPHVNASTSPASAALHLPTDGRYLVDEEGYICEMLIKPGKKGEPAVEFPVRLFLCKISEPHGTKEPSRTLSFKATEDLGSLTDCTLKNEDMTSLANLTASLVRQGVLYNVKHKTRLEEFFMSWLNELHQHVASSKSRPFGWVIENGKRAGFSFGGTLYRVDGTTEPCGNSDPATRKMYTPHGDIAVWTDALKLVTEQENPFLEILVACAFATPILWATGETGGTLGLWSETGNNKTTALKIGLSVWGHPVLTKMPATTTEKSLEEKLGTIECLPAVVDDLQGTSFAQVTKMLFTVTQGLNRGRLKQDTTQREQKMWETMVIVTANNSFYDYMVNSKAASSNADLVRMLELNMPPVHATGPGRVSTAEAGKRLKALEHNFGNAGLEYVKWMVSHMDYIDQYVANVVDAISSEVSVRKGERFWVSAIAAILSGAHFANEVLACGFRIDKMHGELINAYHSCRAYIKTAELDGTSHHAVQQALSAFMARHYGNQLWTNTIPMGPGKPASNLVVLKGPNLNADRPVQIHWAVEDRVVRFGKSVFLDFLNEKKYNSSNILKGLENHYSARSIRGRLGSGTTWSMLQERCWELPIPHHHELEPTLFQHTPFDQKPEHLRNVVMMPTSEDVKARLQPTGLDGVALPAVTVAGIQQAQEDAKKVA